MEPAAPPGRRRRGHRPGRPDAPADRQDRRGRRAPHRGGPSDAPRIRRRRRRGAAAEAEEVPLAQVIADLNDRYGLDLGTADQVWAVQQVVAIAEDPVVAQAGLVNDIDKFGQVFDQHLERVVVDRADANDTLVKRFFDDQAFLDAFTHVARRHAYELIRPRPAARHSERTTGTGPGPRTWQQPHVRLRLSWRPDYSWKAYEL